MSVIGITAKHHFCHLLSALWDDNDVKTVRLLVQAGANVSDKDECGRTPLHVAAMNCCVEVVEGLLELGADKTLRNANGETAYMLIPGNCDDQELKALLYCEDE